jgi:hypothetical protein
MFRVSGRRKPVYLFRRLEEILGAANIELSAEDLHEIENAASNIKVERARYPENLQKMVGR